MRNDNENFVFNHILLGTHKWEMRNENEYIFFIYILGYINRWERGYQKIIRGILRIFETFKVFFI